MASTEGPVPRPGILDIAPYVGGEAKIAGVARPIRLASNESALGPSPRAMAAFLALTSEIHRYPEGSSEALREAIGQRHGLDPARIVGGAGSDELIALLLRSYAGPGDEVLYSRHGFLMYPIGALSVGAKPIAAPERDLTADVDALLERVSPRTRMVFLPIPIIRPAPTSAPMNWPDCMPGSRPGSCSPSTRPTPNSSTATIMRRASRWSIAAITS